MTGSWAGEQRLAMIVGAMGFALLTYIVIVEDEPGAVPLCAVAVKRYVAIIHPKVRTPSEPPVETQ